ncbi:hypothetical protein FKR81_24045 [Lentzea tibetensis]|uniref:Secreted protein n=1 Tax=Lentzea tibetensis TaxID=2591470 RepID=A0A563EQ39_9PSEU|nr:hypothetical protein [Lentzea tibetensis]TWP49602.1 hypothetical protein FKR81_24045 [Lentzea tibetensis]
MRRFTRYLLGALALTTAVVVTRDVAGGVAVAGTPQPMSRETMLSVAAESCAFPPGYRPGVARMFGSTVVHVGTTDDQLYLCDVYDHGHGVVSGEAPPPGDQYFRGGTGIGPHDDFVQVGRLSPEVAALEAVLPDGRVVPAEIEGDTYLYRAGLPSTADLLKVRLRAYDATGKLLREGA